MSTVKRISEEADEFVSNNKREGEDWMEAHDRLLGVGEEYVTRDEVHEIAREEIQRAKQGGMRP